MAPMSTIKTVCVYCGSGPGTNPRFTEGAKALGKALAENNVRLVYGGGSVASAPGGEWGGFIKTA